MRARTSRRRWRSRARYARRRARASAPKACSCSVATATSPSIPLSVGTATCRPWASSRAPCSYEPVRDELESKAMINLEVPRKFVPLVAQANQVAKEVFRPISRKYDEAEHEYPKELDMLAALIDGMNDGSESGGAGGAGGGWSRGTDEGVRNRSNMSTALGIMELCWGDVGLLLSMPRQGLGNSAIASVANDE